MVMDMNKLILLLLISLSLPCVSAPQPFDPDLRNLLKETIASADSFHDQYDAEVWLVDMSKRLSRFKRLKMMPKKTEFFKTGTS